ncbi:glutathione S-transferase [Crepidotus variabilis]|uniref:glutathione transferase n=1 Tax=Crepidotus variabilis TaxID=179855 RepID=A0A9P6ES49_9AGAR|nr:glutathione S-transferase [Crepidotus variabilis]
MVLKLYGNAVSPCTHRVALVLNEKEVPFEFHSIEFAKIEHKSPSYLEKQPFGQVPYIEDDDGFILYESRAIALYIATKYPDQGTKGLVPTDPKANALFHQAVYVEVTHFDDPAAKVTFEKNVKPKYFKGPVDEAYIEKLSNTLDAKLSVYDKILEKQKYLAGEELTLADLYHLPYGVQLAPIGIKNLVEKPNVSRWFKELEERKSWLDVKKTFNIQ